MKRILKAFLYSVILGLIALYSVSFFWKNPLELTIGLIIISILILTLSRKKEDLALYIICGIAGAIAEITAIQFGAWQYSLPYMNIIPYWLPFLWGIAAVFIKRISLEIDDFFKNRTVSA
jgi:hypothetical protein